MGHTKEGKWTVSVLREVSAGSVECLRGEEKNMNDYVQDNLFLFNN
jgi:hypothetical protein